ncbi:MAG: MATE family efflux transporter [Ruminiclostridium sp.]|nr:MATE family efflux transporter [Ruminiclostridium sp.]
MNNRRQTLIKYVVPAMLTNVCYFLFTIVDGLFVGNGVGETALGAVNVAIPFTMIVMAIGMLTSIGGAVVAAISIGEGDMDHANSTFFHSFSMTVVVAVIVMLTGALLSAPLAGFLGADTAHKALTMEYLFWWSLFALPSLLSVNLQGFCRNDGAPTYVTIATIASTLLNVFLDWLFVFPLGMGVKGAAIATGLSQTVNMLIVWGHFLTGKAKLRLKWRPIKGSEIAEIVFCGFPEMIAQFATPVMTICMNQMLGRHVGEIGIDAFAIISYVASFSMAVLFGSAEGLQPIFGQSYGAKKKGDLQYYLRCGIIICLVGSAICVLLADLFSRPIAVMFGAEGNLADEVVRNMPKYSWAFIVAGINTIISGYLYSTEKTKSAILLNVLRSFVVCTAVIVGLTMIFKGTIVWFTFGISEGTIAVIAAYLLKAANK